MRQSLTKKYITEHIIPELEKLRDAAAAFEHEFQEEVVQIPTSFLSSAQNLLHYMALRQSDIRNLQKELAMLGLSRLGRSEAHVLSSLDAVIKAASALAGSHQAKHLSSAVDINTGGMYLSEHALKLLGAPLEKHGTRIMVTMPSEAAYDGKIIHDLLKSGMNVMRINCAHDTPVAWMKMINHLRKFEKQLDRPCKIYADLAGPKLRTGNISAAGRMIEIKVKRDYSGRVIEPTKVWVTPSAYQEESEVEVSATIPVPLNLLDLAHTHDSLLINDSRGVKRALTLNKKYGKSWLAHAEQHIYIEEGANCSLYRKSKLLIEGTVSPLPEYFQPILLHIGDILELIPNSKEGAPARFNKQGEKLLRRARIPCSLPEVFEAAKPEQPIWFDDGKIGGRILSNNGKRIEIEITQASPKGSKLTSGKGINLPLTDLHIPALTAEDIENLSTLAPYIDLIGLSFVRTPRDVQLLHRILDEKKINDLGVVIKIETVQAFENLPMILLTALRRPPVGIMVARGDLAVEIGFERLAEVQEEILWLCEAAHIPVIWATQVLESMAKDGMPSRAEVSDAALSIRAECVMLNKGPYMVETIRFLAGVLERMSGHQIKRSPTMRRLSISHISH
ncbi:MAG: pyruvate kinase [Gallionellaceae bacterium]|nr:pyruvate kinase [Gallionellaceae bacterium]